VPFFLAAAEAAHVKPIIGKMGGLEEFEDAVRGLEGGGSVVLPPDATFTAHQEAIARLLSARRVPAIYVGRVFVEAGGLMSYGDDAVDQFRRAGAYVDRILKGQRAADLPVQAPVAFPLVINRKAAAQINIVVPSTLLARADEAIE
jgi:putative ABC transport system substrate-binding protein